MTRTYGGDCVCTLCHKPGSMGWLYRCTQDAELVVEDDLRNGKVGIDDLSDVLYASTVSKKRNPKARTPSPLAIFDVTSHKDLDGHSVHRINTLLAQRARVSETIKGSGSNSAPTSAEELRKDHILSLSMPSAVDPISDKTWVPTQQCQFKCCHGCRPSSGERSFLSLDAVANGEFPYTAVAGFGFQYLQSRPVSLVQFVSNLGLRPNPPLLPSHNPTPMTSTSSSFSTKVPPPRQHAIVSTLAVPASPFNDGMNADTTFGQPSNAYDSTAMVMSVNTEPYPESNGKESTCGPTAQRTSMDMKLVPQPYTIVTNCNGGEIEAISDATNETPSWAIWNPPNTPGLNSTFFDNVQNFGPSISSLDP